MEKIEFKPLFQEIGNNLLNYNVESHSNDEIIADILEIETALFRARIKFERELTSK